MFNNFEPNSIDRQILRVMLQNGGWLSLNQISSKTRLSWNTVNKHIQTLTSIGYVLKSVPKEGIIYYKANA